MLNLETLLEEVLKLARLGEIEEVFLLWVIGSSGNITETVLIFSCHICLRYYIMSKISYAALKEVIYKQKRLTKDTLNTLFKRDYKPQLQKLPVRYARHTKTYSESSPNTKIKLMRKTKASSQTRKPRENRTPTVLSSCFIKPKKLRKPSQGELCKLQANMDINLRRNILRCSSQKAFKVCKFKL